MKRRVFAAALAALLLTGCGSRGESGSASSQEAPEEPVVIGTLALELPAGGDADAARAFADSLPEAMAALGVEIGRVALSFSPSPAAAAQALAEGGVDLAFLPVEDFLAGGGGQAVLADGEPDTSRTLTPGDRAEIVTAGTDYGRRLAARTDPSWEELAHARWGVLGQESRAGYRCLDLWLCDNYEDNGIRDLPEVKEARRAQVDHLCDLHRLRACMVDPRHVVGEHPAGHLLPLSDFGHLKGSRLRKRVTVNHFTAKSRLRPVHRHIAVERKAVQIVHHQPCPAA